MNALAVRALLSPKDLSPPHRIAFLLMRMSVSEGEMAWPTAKEVTGRLGAPLFSCVQLCSYIVQCPLWGYVCMNTHAYLNSGSVIFSGSRPPALCPLCRSSSGPCSWQSLLGGGRAISVPEIWNFAHISTGQLFLLQRPHPHLLYQSLLLSPKHYLFSLCLRQYDCQHVRWFLKA